ncbi:hypothetical protein PGIGA_G00145450, partial [Pangasianodon gigas]|nr:hypothetical protein [Pangasianodon gigas]
MASLALCRAAHRHCVLQLITCLKSQQLLCGNLRSFGTKSERDQPIPKIYTKTGDKGLTILLSSYLCPHFVHGHEHIQPQHLHQHYFTL